MAIVKKTPIQEKKEFGSNGAKYYQLKYNPQNCLYLYEVKEIGYDNHDNPKEAISFEVVKGVPFTQPDGEKVLTYPCAEQFGIYGWAFNSYEWAYKCWAEGYDSFCEWRNEWRKSKTVQ